MKTIISKTLQWCFVFLLVSSCESESSADVNQDRIFAAYGALYDEFQDLTIVNVTFSLGNYNGTRLELADGASISFNDREVPFLTGLGYYELKLPGFVQEGTFIYTDLDNQIFTNSLSIRTIDFAQETPTTINRAESYEISWDGEPVGSGDSSVVASIIPNNLGESKFFPQNNDGATAVLLTPNFLGTIADAQGGAMLLERFDISEANSTSSAGGLVTARYRPKSIAITIE